MDQCYISDGNPLLHALQVTGAILQCRSAEHLAYFSLELSTSTRDMPWLKSEFNDGGVEHVGQCDVELVDAHLLLVKNEDDSAKFE